MFDEKNPYNLPDKGTRPVAYGSKPQIEDAIIDKFPPLTLTLMVVERR